MLSITFILSVFVSTINGGNQYLQRLTGAGSATGQIGQQFMGFGGNSPDTQNMELFTSPPLTKPLEYHRNGETDYIPNGRYPKNHEHNHNHDHNHNKQSNVFPESSSQSYEKPRNYNNPQAITTNRNINKAKQTTERYNRDTSLISSSNNRLSQTRANVTNSHKLKDTNRMIFPTAAEISIVFGDPPEPYTPPIKTINTRSTSKNCSFGLCNEVDNYPAKKILEIINRSRELQEFFDIPDPSTIPDVDNRFGDNEETLCSTMVHTQFPQSAQNVDNEEKFLVNVGDYKQGIVYETCVTEGKTCQFADVFPSEISTSCKQKYTIRRLMALAKDSDKAEFDNFRLPSCCVCVTKKN